MGNYFVKFNELFAKQKYEEQWLKSIWNKDISILLQSLTFDLYSDVDFWS